ncbi:MAG: sensor histidine kinase [Reyranellaceae bacterium]
MSVRLLELFRVLRRVPPWLRYLLTATFIVGVHVVGKALVEPRVGDVTLVFLPAILLCAFLFDRGSGFLATAIAVVLAIPRTRLVGLDDLWRPPFIELALFTSTAILLVVGVEALRRAVEELGVAAERLAAADARKHLLLQDVTHRIKNHLASIAGLLSRSSRRVVDTDQARDEFSLAASRVAVLGRVYDRLDLANGGASIGVRPMLEGLCRDLATAIVGDRPIAIEVLADDSELGPNRAVFLGLLVNELVQNAVKHAFPGDRGGTVSVRWAGGERSWRLVVADDGVGLSAATDGTGRVLANAFASELGGTIAWRGPPGTEVEVSRAA